MSDINDINAENVNFGTQNFHAPVYFGGRSIEPPPKPNRSIFLIYKPDDGTKPFIQQLISDLTAANFEVWWEENIASHPIASGNKAQVVSEARSVILVIQEEQTEDDIEELWHHALYSCTPIVPIILNDTYTVIPEILSNRDKSDFRERALYKTSLEELKRILESHNKPLATLYGVPGLPESYIERAAMVRIHDALLQESKKPLIVSAQKQTAALTVHGLGGIGKTTLASALARSCEVRRAFPDGIFWMEIGKETEDVLSRMADIGVVFGDPREEYPDLTRAKQRLSALLAGKKALIVLDDVWNHEIVNHFRVSDARLLVTTRQSGMVTKLDAHEEALETLTPDEGLRLIAQRLTKPEKNIYVSPADLPPECAEIVSFLDGHTLAVSLAAAKLDKKGIAYAADLLDRLKQNRLFTEGDQTLDIPSEDKNLNLERSLILSYEDLSDDLKRRWRALGVFAIDGTFDRDAVMSLWGDTDKYVAEDRLENLLDAGLIQHADGNRFKQHSLLRAYAYALLSDQDEAHATAVRHFEHYETHHGESQDHTDLDYLQSITPDVPNLQIAIHWGLAHFPERACDLLSALDNFFRVYQSTSIYQPLLAFALLIAEKINYQKGAANTLQAMGDLSVRQSELSEAQGYYDRALPMYEAIGDRLGAANTLKAMGDLSVLQDELSEVQGYYDRALPMYEAIGDRLGAANTLKAMGDLSVRQSELSEAQGYYDRALPMYEAIGARLGAANTLKAMGDLSVRQDELSEAQGYYDRALPMYEAIGARLGAANTLRAMGELSVRQDELSEAQGYYDRALLMYEAIGARLGAANTLRAMGELSVRQSELSEAQGYYDRALPMYEGIGDRLGAANTLKAMGDLSVRQSELSEAQGYYDRALLMYEAIGARLGAANTLKAMGDLSVRQSELSEAQGYYDQAELIYNEVKDISGKLNVLISNAHLARIQNDIPTAKTYYDRLFEITDNHPAFRDHPITRKLKEEYSSLLNNDTSSQADEQDQAMQMLAQLYAQGGADAIRNALKGKVPDEVIEQLITLIEQNTSEDNQS